MYIFFSLKSDLQKVLSFFKISDSLYTVAASVSQHSWDMEQKKEEEKGKIPKFFISVSVPPFIINILYTFQKKQL